MRENAAVLLLCLTLASCGGSRPPSQSEPSRSPEPDAASESRRPVLADLPQIDIDAVLTHTKTLSSDEFEGRGPGTRGETRTVNFLVDQFKALGLDPGMPGGSYTQKVPLVGITAIGAPQLTLKKGTAIDRLTWKDDYVAWTKHVAENATIQNSELVFVGYGVEAPEYNWDDYKGVDVKGKTLVMLINDPPVPDPSNPSQLDPKTFGGRAMTYYGRWTYKYEIAAQKGAAGVLIVHETLPAGYPFGVLQSSFLGENFDLVTPDKNMGRAAIEGWVTLDQGRRILNMAGQDYDELKKLAATRDFKPVPLGVTASLAIHNKLRTIDSQNVVAKLQGSDPALRDECVVYMAHWDHLGVSTPVNGDRIYNGAVDNATGVAGLIEIGSAFTRLATKPKRSIVFLATTAEEQGLLGSQYYAANPAVPLSKTLAAINMDSMNVHGRTKDVTVIGYGASDLDDYIRDAAAEQGRIIRPDPEPEKGYYYRSDHFNFAKEGVPALFLNDGVDFIGKPADYGQKIRDDYEEHDYHKPSDEVRSDWDLSGDREDLKLLMAVGYRVAQAPKFPDWKPGNEFKAKRDARLKAGAASSSNRANDTIPANSSQGSSSTNGASSAVAVAEIEAFRKAHEASYAAEYVPLAGLVFLKPGINTVGSAPRSDVRLPARVPASMGRFVYDAEHQTVRFEPSAGSPVTIKNARVAAPVELRSDEHDEYTELAIGDVAFWLHESGDRRAIRLRDPQSAQARSFAGYRWFAIDLKYRVAGRFIKDPSPREVKTPSLAGDLQPYTTEGVVEFTLDGQTLRLRPMTTAPNQLFFVFRDGTSGKETYEAARFLYSDLRPDGTTILDFNQAYNPPCAFNPFTTCPLPLPENRLTVRIPAGEKAYAGKHS